MSRTVSRSLRALLAFFLVPVLLFLIAGALYTPNTEIPPGFSGKHVLVHGTPLRVLQRGSGRDVLLIHGSPGSIEDWQPMIDALSASYRVTAFDRPGHGFSGDTGAYSFRHNAQIAIALIDTLKLEHVVVAGHSYGGATALAMALEAPRQVDSYVVIDSATYRGSRPSTALMRLIHVPLLGVGLVRFTPSSITDSKIHQGLVTVFNGREPAADFVALRTRLWSTPKVAHAIAAETLGSTPELQTLSPGYPGIKQPVHILSQTADRFRKQTAEQLHRDIADSTLTLVRDTAHFVQLEQPGVVIAAIRSAAEQD